MYVNLSDAVDGLFECCAVSDAISCQIIDALKKTNLQSKDEHFKDHVIRNLGKVIITVLVFILMY
jgi:hypothetical protein